MIPNVQKTFVAHIIPNNGVWKSQVNLVRLCQRFQKVVSNGIMVARHVRSRTERLKIAQHQLALHLQPLSAILSSQRVNVKFTSMVVTSVTLTERERRLAQKMSALSMIEASVCWNKKNMFQSIIQRKLLNGIERTKAKEREWLRKLHLQKPLFLISLPKVIFRAIWMDLLKWPWKF